MRIKNYKSLFLCIFNFSTVAFAGGGGGLPIVYDPWNFQNTASTALNAYNEYKNTLEQLKYEMENFKNYDGNEFQWSNIQGILEQLAYITQQGNAISYSMQNIDSVFHQRFPGYKPSQNYTQDYQSWSDTTMSTLTAALQSAGLQANEFSTEQDRLEQLRRLSSTAKGRMQAAQVGNMIASEEVGQSQKLRQLIMNQTNSQNAYMAYRVQKEQTQVAAESQLFNKPKPFPKYGSGDGFGADTLPRLAH